MFERRTNSNDLQFCRISRIKGSPLFQYRRFELVLMGSSIAITKLNWICLWDKILVVSVINFFSIPFQPPILKIPLISPVSLGK